MDIHTWLGLRPRSPLAVLGLRLIKGFFAYELVVSVVHLDDSGYRPGLSWGQYQSSGMSSFLWSNQKPLRPLPTFESEASSVLYLLLLSLFIQVKDSTPFKKFCLFSVASSSIPVDYGITYLSTHCLIVSPRARKTPHLDLDFY